MKDRLVLVIAKSKELLCILYVFIYLNIYYRKWCLEAGCRCVVPGWARNGTVCFTEYRTTKEVMTNWAALLRSVSH